MDAAFDLKNTLHSPHREMLKNLTKIPVGSVGVLTRFHSEECGMLGGHVQLLL